MWETIKDILSVAIPISKDILLVATPIFVAYLSYRSNKKSRKEIMTELEAKLKEKDKDTANEIQKMSAELENQKQLISWNSSQPQTDEYLNRIDVTRRGNVTSLTNIIREINLLLSQNKQTKDELENLKKMLSKIQIPDLEQELYPYEIPILYDYHLMLKNLDKAIKDGEPNE